MIELEQKNIRLGSVLSYSILLGPLLGQYASFIQGVSLADLLLIISTCLIIFFNSRYIIKLNKVKPVLILWFFGIIISILSFLLQRKFNILILTRMLRFSFYLLLIVVCADNLNKRILFNAYKKLVVIISVYIILQFIIFKISGILLPFKLLPFPWMDGRLYNTEQAIQWANVFYLRPSGFFVEPAYAAQYILPGLVFSLYGWESNSIKKTNILSSLLVLISLFLTNSSTAIVISVIVIILYLLKRIRQSKRNMDIVRNIIIVLFIIVTFMFFLYSKLYIRTISYIIGNIKVGGSTALRVFRGFAVFLKLPILFKIIGVGHGNLGTYVINNNITTIYDSTSNTLMAADYVNATSASLLYYGVVGFIVYLNIFIYLFINTKGQFRMLTIVLFMLSCISSIFFDTTMLFYMSLIYIGYESRKKRIVKIF